MGIMVKGKKSYTSSNASTASDRESSSNAGAGPTRSHETTTKHRASRAGTRCVSTLSSDQLTRKRANDREAQRAIRQRTKDHIESLERRIEELTEADGDATALVNACQRNRELERELAELRDKLNKLESYSPSYKEWPPAIRTTPASVPSSVFSAADTFISGSGDLRESDHSANTSAISLPRSSFGDEARSDRQHSIGQHVPGEHGVSIRGPWNSHDSNDPVGFIDPTYIPPGQSFPSAPLNVEVPSLLAYRPPLHSWELPIRHTPPTNVIDNLLINFLQTQRGRAPSATIPNNCLLAPANMRDLLYCEQGSSTLSDPISNVIAEILHSTQIANLPEKAACLYVMHKLLCWQISPFFETYEKMPEWFSPRPSQLVEPHALWVSHIVWPKLRDKVIRNQAQYATEEFRDLYTVSLSVNWPYRDIDVLMFEDGEVRVTPIFESHVCRLENWSLHPPFTNRYPELQDVCRFTDAVFRDAGIIGS